MTLVSQGYARPHMPGSGWSRSARPDTSEFHGTFAQYHTRLRNPTLHGFAGIHLPLPTKHPPRAAWPCSLLPRKVALHQRDAPLHSASNLLHAHEHRLEQWETEYP